MRVARAATELTGENREAGEKQGLDGVPPAASVRGYFACPGKSPRLRLLARHSFSSYRKTGYGRAYLMQQFRGSDVSKK
jgi:hypothetical protein